VEELYLEEGTRLPRSRSVLKRQVSNPRRELSSYLRRVMVRLAEKEGWEVSTIKKCVK